MAKRMEEKKRKRKMKPVSAGPGIRPNVQGLKPVTMDWSRPTPHVYALWSPAEKNPDLATTTFRKPTL
jgi:hypothetical protein